jgi:hypothetical protein
VGQVSHATVGAEAEEAAAAEAALHQTHHSAQHPCQSQLRRQNVKRMVSEREPVVELPWLRTVVRA